MFFYNKKKLAKEVIQCLLENDPCIDAKYVKEKDLVEYGGSYVSLTNIYNNVKVLKKMERIEYIRDFMFKQTEIKKENLIPLIRIKSQTDLMIKYQFGEIEKQLEFVTYNLSENFYINLVADDLNKFTNVNYKNLDEMGLNKEQAYEKAINNLKSMVKLDMFKVKDGIYQSMDNGDLEPSRILLENFNNYEIKGEPVIFIPRKNRIILCGSEDIAAINEVSSVCKNFEDGLPYLSLISLIYKNGKWHEFKPERNDDYAVIHNMIYQDLSEQYGYSKELIQENLGAKGDEIFLADYKLFNRPDSQIYHNMAVLTEGVATWLPKSHTILFNACTDDKPNILGELKWEIVLEEFPEHFKKLDGYPLRYEVLEFPPKDKLVKLIEEYGAKI